MKIGFKESLYRVLNLRTCEGILVIRCVVVKIATPHNFSRTWEIDNKNELPLEGGDSCFCHSILLGCVHA